MTIVTTTTFSGPYAAVAQTIFAVTFQSAGAGEVEVTLAGVIVNPSLYTFTRNTDGTGTVTFLSAVTGSVVIYSKPNLTQTTSFSRFGAWYPDQMNTPLDKEAAKTLYLHNILIPSGSTRTTRASKYLAWDTAGDPVLTTAQGPIGPSGDITVSGVTFRTPQQYGSVAQTQYVADLVNDGAGIQAAIDSYNPRQGGKLIIPRGFYYSSQDIIVTHHMDIEGEGQGTRTRVAFEVDAADIGTNSYVGTVIKFAAGKGFKFHFHTDSENSTDVIRADMTAVGQNSAYYEFQGADRSSMKNIVLLGTRTTDASTTTGHGVEHRCLLRLEDMLIVGFGGHGVYNSADFDLEAGAKFGNTSGSSYTRVHCAENTLSGFRNEGRDASVVKFDHCKAMSNGAWGFDDNGFLGNRYDTCEATQNNVNATYVPATYPELYALKASANTLVGAFRATGNVAPHLYEGCYVEVGNGSLSQLTNLCQIIGGTMAAGSDVNSGLPFYLQGNTLKESGLVHVNDKGAIDIAAEFGTIINARTRVFAFGSSDASPTLLDGQRSYEFLYYGVGNRWWSLEQPDTGATTAIFQIPNAMTDIRRIAMALPRGFFIGDAVTGGVKNHINAGSTQPDGVYNNGDIVLRSAVTDGGKVGWTCVTAGTLSTVAWAAGVIVLNSTTDANATYRTNAGNTYKLLVQGGGAAANAPVHVAGTVVGADGYSWQWRNASTLPLFREFGRADIPSGSATYDPPSLADGAGATTTVTVTGAALGDFAEASFSLDLQGITLTAWVSAANTVSVRFQNETGGVLDLASGTLRAAVRKP